MTFAPHVRKVVLTAHIASSVGLVGAVAAFLLLALAGLRGLATAYPAMELIAWTLILPLAILSLLIGITQALGTRWGLLRHWWVVVKLIVTVFALVVLLVQMDGISTAAELAGSRAFARPEFATLRMSLAVHAGGGLIVLLVPLALSVFKPGGLTRYARREESR